MVHKPQTTACGQLSDKCGASVMQPVLEGRVSSITRGDEGLWQRAGNKRADGSWAATRRGCSRSCEDRKKDGETKFQEDSTTARD